MSPLAQRAEARALALALVALEQSSGARHAEAVAARSWLSARIAKLSVGTAARVALLENAALVLRTEVAQRAASPSPDAERPALSWRAVQGGVR
jgi:hypothetical protein